MNLAEVALIIVTVAPLAIMTWYVLKDMRDTDERRAERIKAMYDSLFKKISNPPPSPPPPEIPQQMIQMRGTDLFDLLLAIKNGQKLPQTIEERVMANVLMKPRLYEDLQKIYLGKKTLKSTDIRLDTIIDDVEKDLRARGIEHGRLIAWED